MGRAAAHRIIGVLHAEVGGAGVRCYNVNPGRLLSDVHLPPTDPPGWEPAADVPDSRRRRSPGSSPDRPRRVRSPVPRSWPAGAITAPPSDDRPHPARPDRPGALSGIGHTPLVRLDVLVGPDDADVWVKLEAANPTGSYKDRMALAMIEGAERRGILAPGQTVVEYTGGSTGSSLAFVCAVKGYPLRIVSSTRSRPRSCARWRRWALHLEIIDSPQGIHPGCDRRG